MEMMMENIEKARCLIELCEGECALKNRFWVGGKRGRERGLGDEMIGVNGDLRVSWEKR
jgi:hypothetical protein